MQHLTLEALARLVDEPPGQAEAAHLDRCEACRAELAALRRDIAALGRLGPIEAGAGEWAALEARLEHEGMLADRDTRAIGSGRSRGLLPATAGSADDGNRVGHVIPLRTRARPWTPRLLRLAAALALYAGGAATGLALHGRLAPGKTPNSRFAPPALPGIAATPVFPRPATPFPQVPSPATQATATVSAASPREAPAATDEPAGVPPDPIASAAAAAADRATAGEHAEPGTPAEAVRAIRAAQAAYIRAYSRYVELTSRQQEVEDPVARAAALESIILTTRAALDRAPSDPVINGYHLSAIAQRDAALRQIVLRSNGRWF